MESVKKHGGVDNGPAKGSMEDREQMGVVLTGGGLARQRCAPHSPKSSDHHIIRAAAVERSHRMVGWVRTVLDELLVQPLPQPASSHTPLR